MGSPEDAEEMVWKHYSQMLPQERLDELVLLLNNWGKWHERRLERTAQVLTIP